jgi:hypothetical protein
MCLEAHYGLDAEDDVHLWLLQHLFIDVINAEARDWVKSWNSHTLNISGEPNQSPEFMFFDGRREGTHGLIPDDLASYGVDYAAQRDPRVMSHLREHNPEERGGVSPQQLSGVVCEPLDTPLLADEIGFLNAYIDGAGLNPLRTFSMDARKGTWQAALHLVENVLLA